MNAPTWNRARRFAAGDPAIANITRSELATILDDTARALKPFANASQTVVMSGNPPERIIPADDDTFFGGDQIKWGDLRRAAAILELIKNG